MYSLRSDVYVFSKIIIGIKNYWNDFCFFCIFVMPNKYYYVDTNSNVNCTMKVNIIFLYSFF